MAIRLAAKKESPHSPRRSAACAGRWPRLFPPFQEERLPAFFPGVPLVHDRREVDEAEIALVERALDLAVHRNAACGHDEALAFGRKHEIHEEERRVRVRRL